MINSYLTGPKEVLSGQAQAPAIKAIVFTMSRSDKGGSLGGEGGLVGSGGGSLDGSELGELDVGLEVLHGGVSLGVVAVDHHGLDEVDGVGSGGVTTGHLVVDHGHGVVEGVGPDLSVHVDDTLPGEVLEHEPVDSHGGGLLLEDLVHRDDLALALSDLVLALHLVPELGPGKYLVLSEHADSVASRLRLGLAGQLSSDDPVLSDLQTQH